jgi:hypothetical protein
MLSTAQWLHVPPRVALPAPIDERDDGGMMMDRCPRPRAPGRAGHVGTYYSLHPWIQQPDPVVLSGETIASM